MRHPSDDELVDAIEGRMPGPVAAHLAACTACAARTKRLREILAEAAGVPVPEPSPLFWDHFSARVKQAIAEQPAPRSGFAWHPLRAPAWMWGIAVVLAVGIVASVVWRGFQAGVRPAPRSADARASVGAPAEAAHDLWNDDVDADQAWAVVRAVAEDVGMYDASEAGIAVRPQTAERVVPQLSSEERTELARLIEEELKRSGA